jgi:hypothetical protein
MLTSQARVQTERASEYLARLCAHLEEVKGKTGHRGPRAHFGSAAGGAPGADLEWSGTRAVARIGASRCTMQADPGVLTLRAEAANEEALQQIQDLFGGRLEKFGHREHVKVTWQQTATPAPEENPQP